MKFLSMQFTANFIEIYQMEVKGRNAVVHNSLYVPMPANTYVSGMLINNDLRISELLTTSLKEEKIKDKKVVVTVTPTDCLTEEFSLPKGKTKVLDGMVQQELQKRRKLNANYIYDYIVLGDDPLKEGCVLIRAVLCPKSLIANYYDVLKKAGLEPYRIDLISHSMELLAARSGLITSNEISILACINEDEIHFLYCGKNEEPYYRHAVIEQGDGLEESMFVLSAATKIDLGIDKDENLIDKVIENVTRLSRFHSQRHPDVNIRGILVYGSYPNITTLCDRITQGVGIPAKVYNPAGSITGLSVRQGGGITKDVTSIGLALFVSDQSQQYQFFDEFLKQKEGKHRDLMMLPIVIALLAVFVVVILYQNQKKENKELQNEIEDLEMTINDPNLLYTYYTIDAAIIEAKETSRYADRGDAFIEKLTDGSRFKSDYIRIIDENTPKGVEISAYYLSEGKISLTCSGNSQYLPATFTEVLSGLPEFSEVFYSGFQQSSTFDNESIYTFTITVTIAKEK